MLDAIDRDVLQLLSRRMAIVGEIAGFKREHGVGIRDRNRERSVLQDRCKRAESLGLPPGIIESVYRLILLASREHQAALRAEVPLDVEPRTVAVIGGQGGMGSVMARLFGDIGHAVMVADVDTELAPQEAARTADVVVVSVPIRATDEVIRQVGPHMRGDALLMDVTSLKEQPIRTMLESTRASVVGTHPLFGPGVNTFQGQRVVLCPGRGEGWHDWVRRMLEARGLVVAETSPEEHDRSMALVQVLNHFQTQVLGLAMSRLGIPFEQTLRFTSPAYLLESYVTARHFAQSPELYGPIEMFNPRSGEVTEAFRAAADELGGVVQRGDQERFNEIFQEVRQFFGDFTEEALEQSRFLIDRLIELTAGQQRG
jgi:chorismate mutase/prephenate dehydrogenase